MIEGFNQHGIWYLLSSIMPLDIEKTFRELLSMSRVRGRRENLALIIQRTTLEDNSWGILIKAFLMLIFAFNM